MKHKPETTELDNILQKIPSDKQFIAKKLIDELVFMQETLAALKKKIKEDGITEQFINGRQQFEREAPALTSYTKTVQRYGTMYKQLTDLIPTREEAQNSNPLYDFLKEE